MPVIDDTFVVEDIAVVSIVPVDIILISVPPVVDETVPFVNEAVRVEEEPILVDETVPVVVAVTLLKPVVVAVPEDVKELDVVVPSQDPKVAILAVALACLLTGARGLSIFGHIAAISRFF